MKEKLTGSETAKDPDSRINKSLRKWNCKDGGMVDGAKKIARRYRAEGGPLSEVADVARQKLIDSILRKNKQSKTPPSSSQITPSSKSTPIPSFLIPKDEYMRGLIGKDQYSLSKGGSVRKGYSLGGQPTGTVDAPTNMTEDQSYLRSISNSINSLYKTYLGWDGADQGGLSYWTDQINNGNTSLNDLQNLLSSSDASRQYAQSNPTGFLTQLYRQELGRPPEEGGLQFWRNQIAAGLPLSQIANFVQSTDEAQNYQELSRMYQNALGRNIEKGGLEYWQQHLKDGAVYLDQIEQILQESQEANTYQNTQFINDEYQGLLGRAPTASELRSSLDQLDRGVSQDDFDQRLSSTDASQQYQASNFSPYDVASRTGTPSRNSPRTQLQAAKQANNSVPRSSEELQAVFGPLEQRYNLPIGTLIGMMGIESNYGTNQYKRGNPHYGAFQLSNDIINGRVSGVDRVSNRWDWKESARAAAQYAASNADQFRRQVGRDPRPSEYYNMHQQGLTGAITIARNPNMSAVDALDTIMSKSQATRSIRQNMPPSLQGNVSYQNVSGQDFLDGWGTSFSNRQVGPDNLGQNVIRNYTPPATTPGATTPGTTPTTTPTTGPGASVTPITPAPGSPDTSFQADLGRPDAAGETSQEQFLQGQGIGVPPPVQTGPVFDQAGYDAAMANYRNALSQYETATALARMQRGGALPWGWPGPPSPPGREAFITQPATVPGTNLGEQLVQQGAGGNVGANSGMGGGVGAGAGAGAGAGSAGQIGAPGNIPPYQVVTNPTPSPGYTPPPSTMIDPGAFGGPGGATGSQIGGAGSAGSAGMGGGSSSSSGFGVSYMNKGGAVESAMDVARAYKKGGPVWSKPRPKSLGKPTPLTSSQKSSAKSMAKAAGRPYPNLVDNLRAARKK